MSFYQNWGGPKAKPSGKEFTEVDLRAAEEHISKHFPVPSYLWFYHVGSSYIAGRGKDLDLVLWVMDLDFNKARECVYAAGFEYTGQDSGTEDDFDTYQRGDVNLMLARTHEWAQEFATAAEVCKYLHNTGALRIDDKEGRIKIHRIIMNGEDA